VVIRDFSTMFTALRSGGTDAAARNLPPEMVEEWSRLPFGDLGVENDIFHKYSFLPNEARKGFVLENYN
jgi:hypothetical protein